MSRVGKRLLVARAAEQAGVSRAVAARVFDAVFAGIATELARGRHVTIPGFGSWGIRVHAPRRGRDPRTGEPLAIPPRTKVAFRAGQQLRDSTETSIDPEIFYGEGVARGTELSSVFANLFGLDPATLDLEQFRQRLRDAMKPEIDQDVREFFTDLGAQTGIDILALDLGPLPPVLKTED